MLVTVQDTFNTMHKIKVSLWHLPEDDIRGTSNMMWWVRVSFANNAKGGPNMHKNIRMLNYYWNISEYSNASNVSNVSGYSNIQTETSIRWSLSCFENSQFKIMERCKFVFMDTLKWERCKNWSMLLYEFVLSQTLWHFVKSTANLETHRHLN